MRSFNIHTFPRVYYLLNSYFKNVNIIFNEPQFIPKQIKKVIQYIIIEISVFGHIISLIQTSIEETRQKSSKQ